MRGNNTVVEVNLPVKVVSEANRRECWQAKLRRKIQQQNAVKLGMFNALRSLRGHKGRFIVTLTRIGVRKMDGDNLQRGFKAVRDQVAACIGIDDGAERIEWRYAQERGKPREYAVVVGIEVARGGELIKAGLEKV